MLSKIIFICFVFLSVALLQQGAPVNSQIQDLNSDVKPFKDLTLEIAVSEETLMPLQPIPIVIKQSNNSSHPVPGYNAIKFGSSPIYITVKKSGSGEKAQYLPLTNLLTFTNVKNSEVAPGESYITKEWLPLGLNKYLSEPGTYELQASLSNADRTQLIESNIVTIEIQKPAGADLDAYNLIKNSSFRDYLFSDAEFDKKKVLLETLAAGHSDSVYAKSAILTLAERYFALKEYQQALPYLLRLENDNDFIFAEKVRNHLTEIRRSSPPQPIEEKDR